MITPTIDARKLAEKALTDEVLETWGLGYWQVTGWTLARAVLDLDTENQRLRTALEHVISDSAMFADDDEFYCSECQSARKALEPQP